MRKRRISRADLLAGCTQPGPDDGADPRYDRPEASTRVPNRKALQLCGQVARTLAGILAFECGDDLLRDLAIVSVTPAPNSARLLVTFALPPGRNSAEMDLIADRLELARPMLRCQVAAAIHRRKVPDLLFRFDG